MKYYIILITLVCISSFVLVSCEEQGEHGPIVFDSQSPGVITDVELTPVKGGFDIRFTAPSDADLLYVKASFETAAIGETELRVSKYDNAFEVRGFATEEEKTISFVTVDKSGNESETITAVGTPLRSPIVEIGSSMNIVKDFGGARFAWENISENDLVVELLAGNEFGKLEVTQTLYTSVAEGLANLRGYDPVPTKFAFIIKDSYKNSTDTIYPNTPDKLLIPKLETTLDKDLFSHYQLIEGDEIWTTYGGVVSELWNDITNVSTDFARATLNKPITYFTMDLGVNVKLSRFKLHQRKTRYFAAGAPKVYTVWGTNEIPSPDGDMSGWTILKDCIAENPTGTVYPANDNQVIGSEDLEHALNGDEFSFGDDSPEVRYIRIEFKENWAPSGYLIFTELSFWGELQ